MNNAVGNIQTYKLLKNYRKGLILLYFTVRFSLKNPFQRSFYISTFRLLGRKISALEA